MIPQLSGPKWLGPLLILQFIVGFFSASVAFCQRTQESSVPRIELLTMNGGKPSLSPTGEGMISYKIDQLFERGTTQVTLLKGEIPHVRIELPAGYQVYNGLVYLVQTKAVFTGPSDIAFNLPSANSKQTFEQLRVLYPKFDFVDPEVPKWIDVTVTADSYGRLQPALTDNDIKQRLPNFNSRTIHAITEKEPRVFLIALRDPAKARDNLTADLEITGTVNQQVTEGQSVTYNLKVTNNGPDAATGMSLFSERSQFSFVSANASQGKCRMDEENVYCEFSNLEKNQSIDVKIVAKCPWGSDYPGYTPSTTIVKKLIRVIAFEQDPIEENNELELDTEVLPDSNKGPVLEMVSPTLFQSFPGPSPKVSIRFKASDPDGMVSKLAVFEGDRLVGKPTIVAEGEYELTYSPIEFGRHWITVVATDNLGRVSELRAPEFFVNGLAKVEITEPKSGSKVKTEDGPFSVTIHATNSSSPIKKVSLHSWEPAATPIGNDNYVAKVEHCAHDCRLQAIVIDEKNIETHSDYVDFTMTETPETTLGWFDGEYIQPLGNNQTFKVTDLILAPSGSHRATTSNAKIIKREVFANDEVICTDHDESLSTPLGCYWRNIKPGQYKLYAVVTDADGEVGRSQEIVVIIERP
jgi:hypothetical protein